ncbi:hypothetical protein G9A89_020236 [Geosiphon pyriformis]|nr:hypothetical protein G9A89_020236 [Geosiphon pyriformis]
MAPQQFFHALSNDFGNLLDTQTFSDVRIVVGEMPIIRNFHAHSQILAARSPYFAVALSSNWVKRENNAIIFAKPNISPKEESKIWGKVVEWGVAKLDHNIQMEKVFNWTDENFTTFKESIERLLPLIRFFNKSSAEF